MPRHSPASSSWTTCRPKREDLAPADVLIMQAALRQIEELDREVEALGAEIVRIGKGLRAIHRLLQVHGMNLLSAISMLAEIGDINLFDTSKQLAAYAGLAISTRQSNEITRHGGITKRGRRWWGCVQSSRIWDTAH